MRVEKEQEVICVHGGDESCDPTNRVGRDPRNRETEDDNTINTTRDLLCPIHLPFYSLLKSLILTSR